MKAYNLYTEKKELNQQFEDAVSIDSKKFDQTIMPLLAEIANGDGCPELFQSLENELYAFLESHREYREEETA